MDGVPACVSKQIERTARKDREDREQRRRRKQEQEKTTRSSITELHDSTSSVQFNNVPNTRKQRPKVRFLDLPKDHPLYWDKAALSATDFPEEDRSYLAKILKTPQIKTTRGLSLSTQVVSTLKDLHSLEWDMATLGRASTVLFHPQRNPLDLSPAVARYFYKRFLSLKLDLEDDVEVSYKGKSYYLNYQEGDVPLKDLFDRLREDFRDATHRYEVYQSSFALDYF